MYYCIRNERVYQAYINNDTNCATYWRLFLEGCGYELTINEDSGLIAVSWATTFQRSFQWPRIHEQKNSNVPNGQIRYVKQTETSTHATHVNGWFPAVYMSCMSQSFRLFHVSNLSVRNFRIFLLMYPGPVLHREFVRPPGANDRQSWRAEHAHSWRLLIYTRPTYDRQWHAWLTLEI